MIWTWFDESYLELLKNDKNVDFSETRFCQGKRVGLRLYTDYMISKNGCEWFHWVLTYFALKMAFFLKIDKEIRTLWFSWFRHIWLVKRTCILNCTYMWSKCIRSWDIIVCLLSFDSIATIVLKLWNDIRTLPKMIFKTEYLGNILWIVWYDSMKMCEWLMGVEYDVYHSMVYFLLYLDCEKLYELFNCNDVVDVYWYIYVKYADDVGECIVEYMYGVSYVHASWVLGCLHLVEVV